MLSLDPAWSVVFDACVCVALLWLAHMLSQRRPFRALGAPALYSAAMLLSVPVMLLGRVFSLVVSLIVVPLLVLAEYGSTEHPLPRRYRNLLAAARILVFGIVILCLLRPRLVFEHQDRHPVCAVVLADISTSMENKDCPPAEDRYEALKGILRDNAAEINDLKRECDYRFATFGETFDRADQLPDKPAAGRTNLADAFSGLLRDLGGAKAAGVVLLSDGQHNALGNPVAEARRLGVPVFPICLGAAATSAAFADTSIQHIDCPERVFIKNLAPITVRVAYSGPKVDQLVDVTLTVTDEKGTEKLGSKRVNLPLPGKTADVDLEYVPQTEGIKRLVFFVTPADNDANVRNNTREIFVRVSESALKALFVEGEVRWEYKFLRRAIAAAPNIKLTCVNAFLAAEADQPRLLPADEKDWSELSLLVLGDIPADRFSAAQLDRVKKFVAEGGSLLMIGGFSTLGPGGYGSTPIAGILPVDVKTDNAQKLDAVHVVPTPDGLEHVILALGPTDETKSIWASLPPISGYTKVSAVKPLAKVLIETPDKDPILVVQEYEKGRTAVFAADTTWRWIFNKEKFANYHKAFWRQMVQWLTKSGYGGAGGGGIWCETDRLSYLVGDVPVLTVRAAGKKVENADIAAVIEGPDLKINMPFGRGPGQYTLSLPNPVKKSGSYEVTATALLPATPEKDKNLEARTKFVVQDLDLESENPGANPELLDEIAKATDGKTFDRKDAAKAFDELYARRAGSTITRLTYKRLWDNAYVYIALCALLCTEWIARKRKGLA